MLLNILVPLWWPYRILFLNLIFSKVINAELKKLNSIKGFIIKKKKPNQTNNTLCQLSTLQIWYQEGAT